MPRRPTPITGDTPYHVFARSNNKDWFELPLNICWDIFIKTLCTAADSYSTQPISFVLMSNHFHMIVRTPEANIGNFMNYFMRESSRKIGKTLGRINHIFGGRYKGCLLAKDNYLLHAYKYVYRNPVEANLCDKVEEYPFSSLQYLLGRSPTSLKLFDRIALQQAGIPKCLDERLRWLNMSYSEKQKDMIRNGLRRTVFSFTSDKNLVRERNALELPEKEAGT